MSVDVNNRITEEEQRVEARVEAARAWTPREKTRFVRQTIVMFRELLAEVEWREGVFSDLYDDAYPGCGRECCRDGGGSCRPSDDLAEHDRLIGELSRFSGWLDDLEQSVGGQPLPDPDDELWNELERRLVRAPKGPSPWVQLRRKLRREEVAATTQKVRADRTKRRCAALDRAAEERPTIEIERDATSLASEAATVAP